MVVAPGDVLAVLVTDLLNLGFRRGNDFDVPPPSPGSYEFGSIGKVNYAVFVLDQP